MILQALARYYDILSSDPDSDIAPPGYSAIGISFALNVSAKGELLDVLPLFQQVQVRKKMEEKPRRMIVPEQVKRAVNISANFLWDNCVYVLGISDKEAKDPDYATKRFEAFRSLNTEILGQVNSPASKAVIAFLENYAPTTGREHPKINPHLESIVKGGNLVFMFNGGFAHEDSAIRKIWDLRKSSSGAVVGQCLITGEMSPIARLHPSFSIRGATSTGASLISFNERAYESYNRFKGQGLNSPVSEKAAFAYSTTLKYLLSSSNENRKIYMGDTTVVYWAESEKKEYAKAFLGLCEPEEVEIAPEENVPARDKKSEKKLKKVAEKVRRVQALDMKKLLEGLEDENPRFYVLGLAPNAARVSVRFFHSDPFSKVVEKIMQHYKDLEIIKEFEDQHTYLTIQDILDETVSPKSSDKDASPLLAGSVFRAILENTPYPAALFNSIINRVRADQDDPKKYVKKIGYARAAILKAYLLRKYRRQPLHPIQEVLVMSLNEQSTIPAYLLGRLFAVLEKVQIEAIGDVNASIKDRYFTSACASPASVFPILLRLSQHHISKVGAYYHDKRIEDILNKLDVENNPIPSRLSLDEQGIFMIGYYHQRKDLWTSKKVTESKTTETN